MMLVPGCFALFFSPRIDFFTSPPMIHHIPRVDSRTIPPQRISTFSLRMLLSIRAFPSITVLSEMVESERKQKGPICTFFPMIQLVISELGCMVFHSDMEAF